MSEIIYYSANNLCFIIQSTINWMKPGKKTKKEHFAEALMQTWWHMKHIAIDFHFVWDWVQGDELCSVHILPQLENALTKLSAVFYLF